MAVQQLADAIRILPVETRDRLVSALGCIRGQGRTFEVGLAERELEEVAAKLRGKEVELRGVSGREVVFSVCRVDGRWHVFVTLTKDLPDGEKNWARRDCTAMLEEAIRLEADETLR